MALTVQQAQEGEVQESQLYQDITVVLEEMPVHLEVLVAVVVVALLLY